MFRWRLAGRTGSKATGQRASSTSCHLWLPFVMSNCLPNLQEIRTSTPFWCGSMLYACGRAIRKAIWRHASGWWGENPHGQLVHFVVFVSFAVAAPKQPRAVLTRLSALLSISCHTTFCGLEMGMGCVLQSGCQVAEPGCSMHACTCRIRSTPTHPHSSNPPTHSPTHQRGEAGVALVPLEVLQEVAHHAGGDHVACRTRSCGVAKQVTMWGWKQVTEHGGAAPWQGWHGLPG